ncbi:MAG: chemotaxis protein CheA [Clostridiaceae bacterium]|nr:chemotaxis protein CheA [Clostridiaceae bacterium]
MPTDVSNDSLFDLFIFETTQNLEQMEQLILNNEQSAPYTKEMVDEIFRVMHTIKGSAAMMQFDGMSHFAHKLEDLFSVLRENHKAAYDAESLSDLALSGIDYFKGEIDRLKAGEKAGSVPAALKDRVSTFAQSLRGDGKEKAEKPAAASTCASGELSNGKAGAHKFTAAFSFEEGCMMENIRAFDVLHKLEALSAVLSHSPENLDGEESAEAIRDHGLSVCFSTDQTREEMARFFSRQVFLKDLILTEETSTQSDGTSAEQSDVPVREQEQRVPEKPGAAASAGGMISVNVGRLDGLMDLLGELVIAEAMVLYNPDLRGLPLENFQKAARQLKKITGEMQDLVMSVRMVPLTATFQRMSRIVRDMNRKLGKNVDLKLVGADTEVDKNIIDHIGDPLMHLVRNSLDHGIESPEERRACGKSEHGTVKLEARNDGSEIVLIVRDDGKGLDREKILKRAAERGLLTKPAEDMTAREVFSLIFIPGFSTKEAITEFSGRGVGLDVVMKNIEEVGGRVTVESAKGKGTMFIMRFPLTLAIVEGMNLRVGKALYTIPITNIRESFRPAPNETFFDPDGNEMIMVRGKCYPIVRLSRLFRIPVDSDDPADGILIMVENGDNAVCLLADELLGQQEVVVKAMPKYLKKIRGLSGCTLLGDGQISLILDTGGIMAARM